MDAIFLGGIVDRRALKLHRHDVARMVREEPPPVPWVVEGLVVKGSLTILAGKPGVGKSLLAAVLSVGVMAGEDEAGMRCTRGRAMVVDAENGEHEIHRRVRALRMPGEAVLLEARGFDLRSDLDPLADALVWHCPTFLVLDSFRSLWGGEENDSSEVAAVLDPLRNLVREYEVGALLLHHPGKGGNDYRGSSAIAASVELGFTLARAEGDPDRTRRYLSCWKCRPAPEPPKRWLTLEADGDRVLVHETEPYSSGEPQTPARDSVSRQVIAALAEHGPLRRPDLARSLGRKPTDGTVRRVLIALREGGELEEVDGAWTLPTPPANTANPLKVGSVAGLGRLAGPDSEGGE